MHRILAATLLLCAPLALVAASPPDLVVVARVAHDPVLIWNATPTVYALVGQSVSDRELNAQLQSGARRVANNERETLKHASGTLTVRVVYLTNITPHGTNYTVATMGNSTVYALLTRPVAGGPEHFRVIGKLPGR